MPWLKNFPEMYNVYSFTSAPQIVFSLSFPLSLSFCLSFLLLGNPYDLLCYIPDQALFSHPWTSLSCTQMVTQVLLILPPTHPSNLSVPLLLHHHLLGSSNPFSTLLLKRTFNHTNYIMSFLIWNLFMAFCCLCRKNLIFRMVLIICLTPLALSLVFPSLTPVSGQWMSCSILKRSEELP